MFKSLLGLAFSIWLLSFNTAWAYSYVYCDFNSDPDFIPTPSLSDLIASAVTQEQEKYDCSKDENGYEHCYYKYVWKIPNRIYSTSKSVMLTCINYGDVNEKLSYAFFKYGEENAYSAAWKNLTMSISGGGAQKTFSNMQDIENSKEFTWGNINLAPCQKDCWDTTTAWPRFVTNLTFNFSVQPKVLKLDALKGHPYYDLPDAVGSFWLTGNSNSNFFYSSFIRICGLAGKTTCRMNSGGGGGGGGGSSAPPPKQCTLNIITPDVVAFQPISSDDLSRDRVRMEDFTLTVIKGPDQSTPCMGSVLNLPGEIKTQGGYPISSTFWGINHSSGAPQGIGLKLYDLGKGGYLRFNYQYPSFISDISSISESKRIRAEISATTKDLKKIKDGTYSQVLTFEVKMP
jgi:hypothetical protein